MYLKKAMINSFWKYFKIAIFDYHFHKKNCIKLVQNKRSLEFLSLEPCKNQNLSCYILFNYHIFSICGVHLSLRFPYHLFLILDENFIMRFLNILFDNLLCITCITFAY